MANFPTLSVEDRLDINELLAKYYYANDAKDVDRALAVCTSDATITGDFTMRADHQREDLAKIYASEPGNKRHLMLNPLILSVDGDEVRMQHLMLVIEASLVPATIATSFVTDRLRRTEDGWKIVEHKIEVDDSARWMVKAGQKVQEVIETVNEKLD